MASTAFQNQYRQEFIKGFGQRQSLLRYGMTTEVMIKGSAAIFLVSSAGQTAVTRGVNGLIPARDNDLTQVTATLTELHDLVHATSFNIFASQGNMNRVMQEESMGTINRKIDFDILTEMATGTLETGSAVTASKNLIMKAFVHLLNGGVPNDGNIFAAISPAFFAYMTDITGFSSADYVVVKPHVDTASIMPSTLDAKKNPYGAGWYRWMNVNWIVHPNIVGIGTSTERCFMWHKSAMGHAINMETIASEVGYDREQDYSWARSTIYHAAEILQNTGVVEMTHDGSEFVAS